MSYIKDIIIGIVIGGGIILPGVSGAVLAVIFGIYERIIDSIRYFFKDWKNSIKFLTPLVLGMGIGVVIFGIILSFVFKNYPMESSFTFIGLIIGGIPVLYKKILEKGTKKLNLVSFSISLIIAILLFVLGKDNLNINFSNNLHNGFITFILLFITGIIFISGKIIPGISSSFLLMLIGMYNYFLHVISNPLSLSIYEYIELIPIILGMIVGAIILVKVISNLMDKYHSGAYSSIVGFVIGSIMAIYPGLTLNNHGIISIILFVLSFIISYLFSKSESKLK